MAFPSDFTGDFDSFLGDPENSRGSNPSNQTRATSSEGLVEVTYEPPPPNAAMRKIMKDSELHQKVLSYMKERIEYSEGMMSRFYSRWAANEMRIQAFVFHPTNEQYLKDLNEAGELPNPIRMVIPFGYAALNTIATHMFHTFTSSDPIFQIGNYKDEAIGPAESMQTLIDFQADYSNIIGSLWQMFQDVGLYGVGATQTDWEIAEKMRTLREIEGIAPNTQIKSERRLITVYEGNRSTPIDPFLFFPDPRVPMFKCTTDGEFCFWRKYTSFYDLKLMELEGSFFEIERASKTLPKNNGDNMSSRAKLARGVAIPGGQEETSILTGHGVGYSGQQYRQVDQGTIKVIPKELGISDSEVPQMYMVAMLNKNRIVQLEPFESDHGMHPVVAAEPSGFGYSFGSPAPADYIAPIQDNLSWLFNSHQENVRSFLNNAVVVDPNKIVMKDLRQRRGGQIIRLKESAVGTDVRTVVHQLQLNDVTRGNIADAQILMDLGYMLLAVNESTMGNPQPSSRETATGVRTRAVAATNRLGAQAKLISSQALRPLTEQWVENTQQYMTDEFYAQVVGQRGMDPERNPFGANVAGAYTFPVNDGTLPLDPVAMSGVWRAILEGLSQLPGAAQEYDMLGMFERGATLAGAKEIGSFRRNRNARGGAVPPAIQGAAPDPSQTAGLARILGDANGRTS